MLIVITRFNAFRAGSRFFITRSPAQGSACKDPERNGQSPAITFEAAYTPIPNRTGSRSHKKRMNDSI